MSSLPYSARAFHAWAPLQTLWQVGLLSVAWWLADRTVNAVHLPLSGGVVGLFVLVALLLSGKVRPASVERGANWLLANMLLFFIPLVVSVVQFTQLLKDQGLSLLLDIGLGFICVLLATAWTVENVCRYERQRRLTMLRRQRAARRAA
ncbi:MAG: hypothetical protein RLZZ237_2323 [Pseudomonadota bacterium]